MSIAAWWTPTLAVEAPDFGDLIGGNDEEDFLPMPLSDELGASCEGTATVRRGAVPATGPRIPENREQPQARKLPAIERDTSVVVHIHLTRTRRVHVGQAFNGYPVAVEAREDGFSYVWFFRRCIGRLRVGVDPSVLPLPDQARDPKHPLLIAATQGT